jgi:hypothetical protein
MNEILSNLYMLPLIIWAGYKMKDWNWSEVFIRLDNEDETHEKQ